MAPLPLLAAFVPKLDSLIDQPGGNENNLAFLKLVVAAAALVALAYESSRVADGDPVRMRTKRIVAGLFAAISIVCYFEFFQIGYKPFYHRWEFFHYYMGSKYFREMGYDGLYTCTAVAESELGFRQDVKARKLRDLGRTNSIIPTTEALDHPENCKNGFSDKSWESFKQDVTVFRQVSGSGTWWHDMQTDHGYNPPPVWAIGGWFFAKLHPAAAWYMQLLSCIDVGLFAGIFALIAWAFGWRVACLALVFWGTQDAAPFYWTGGAFLRQDWIFSLIASACLARKRKYFWSGAFLTYSTLLRVFPLFFFAGWVVTAVAHLWRMRNRSAPADARGLLDMIDWRLGRTHRKLFAGALAGALVLIPTSVAICGTNAWPDFVHHISVHNGTPLTNHVGWKTLVAHSAKGRMQVARDNHLTDAFDTWKAIRRDRVKHLAAVYYGGMLLMMAGFAYACWRLRTPWIVLALGCLPATICVELTCYYYSYFILGAMLSRGRRPIEVALLIASVLSEWCHLQYGFFDDRFTAMSLVFVNLALFFVVMYSREFMPSRDEAPATAHPSTT